MMTSTIASLVSSVLPQLVSGGGIGFAAGWVTKKLVKIVAYVFAIVLSLIGGVAYYAQSQGWITVTVNWGAISAAGQAWLTSAASNLMPLIASITAFSGSAGAGFLLGLKTG